MLIDFHVHLGDTVPVPPGDRVEISVHQLIDRMNREGIDRAVLLPLESPEAISGYYTTQKALQDHAVYPERLIPFMSLDPRMPRLRELFELYERRGCVGFGELKNPLAFNDDRNRVIYEECDERGWPLVWHSDPELCPDEQGLPRLEKCASDYPNCKFVCHGPGWWAAISGDDDRSGGYPEGEIKPGGAADRLLGEYDNIYGDISAGSGYNALTRDPEFTEGFLQRHWDKLLFGTDLMYCGQQLPQIQWLQQKAPLSDEQRHAIAAGNAVTLLGLDDGDDE